MLSCKKCGGYDLKLKYVSKGTPLEWLVYVSRPVYIERMTRTNPVKTKEDYFECTCNTCGFNWDGDCLDKVET